MAKEKIELRLIGGSQRVEEMRLVRVEHTDPASKGNLSFGAFHGYGLVGGDTVIIYESVDNGALKWAKLTECKVSFIKK